MAQPEETAIVDAVRGVPGIADAQLAAGSLQLDLNADADEAAVSAAVARVLKDRFGLGIALPGDAALADVRQLRPLPDVRQASPTAPPADERTTTDPLPASRAQLGRLRLAPSGLGIGVDVELTWSGPPAHETVGTADGPATSEGVRRAVAQAAVDAVSQEIGEGVRLDLADFAVAQVGAHKVAIVRITWSGTAGITSLTGASDVRDDVRAALVRAALAAINRKLTEPA